MPNGHDIYQGALEVLLQGIAAGSLTLLDLSDIEARRIERADGINVVRFGFTVKHDALDKVIGSKKRR